MGSSVPGARGRWVWWLRILGTIGSVALLAWLIAQQDWQALVGYARGLPALSLALALGLIAAGQLCNVARWLALLRGQQIGMSYLQAARLAFAGLFASNFLPSTIGGDVVRILGASRASRNRLSGAATVVMDRAVSVFSMLFLLPFSAPLVGSFFGAGRAFAGVSVAAGLPSSWVRQIRDRVRSTLTPWARRPASLALALAASWAGVMCYLLGVWTVARGLAIDVNLAQVAGATGLTYLMTLVPVSINGFGVREAGILALYVQMGATAEQASALALITRGLMMLVSLPGAAWLGASMAGAGETQAEGEVGAVERP
jgi:uncharacterized membrane protein YbhN (UPF0104 family)